MRRFLALAVIITAFAVPALGPALGQALVGQPASPLIPVPAAGINPEASPAEAGVEALPAPAEAPPAPARLDPAARPGHAAEASALTASPIALHSGMQDLANGGWRVRLHQDARDIPAVLRPTLEEIARRLALTTGRVTIIAQAPAPALEPSFARRLSLERGLAMKAILVAGGLEATRIDIRPMGRQANGADVVDILPPGAAR